MKRRRIGQRGGRRAMAALVLPTSVTMAPPVTTSASCGEQAGVLADRRGEDDQVRLGHHHEVVAADVDGVHLHRRLQDVLAIDRDQQAVGPAPARRERQGSANQAAPDDGRIRDDSRGIRPIRTAGPAPDRKSYFRRPTRAA